MANTQEILTVTTVTRPKRVAFLVHEEKLTNDEVNGIISFNCRHWGGRFNPIIPTLDDELRPDWWKLLTSIDPDIIYSFVKLTDALVDRINRHVLPSRIFEIDPEQILKRGGTIGVDEHNVGAITTYEIPRLMWNRRGGWREPVFQFVQDAWVSTDTRTFALRNFGVLPGDMSTRAMFRDIPHKVSKADEADPESYLTLSIDVLQKAAWPVFPIDLSSAFARRCFSPSHESRVPGFHLVIGDSPWEGLYAWNLIFQERPHAGRDSLWLPASVAGNDKLLTSVGKWIAKFFWGEQGDRQGSVVSYSLEKTILERIAKQLTSEAHIHFTASQPRPKNHPFPGSLEKIHRLPDRFAADDLPLAITEQVPVSGDQLMARVAKPAFHTGAEEQFGWMVEVEVTHRPETYSYTNVRPSWRLPKRIGVPQMFREQGGFPARVDWSHGLCFEVPSASDALRVRIPDDRSVFWVACMEKRDTNRMDRHERTREKRQFVDFYTSDKGRYGRGMIQLFGSIFHAGHYFEDPYWRTIFYTLASRAEPEEFEKKRSDLARETLQTWFNGRTDFTASEAQLTELAQAVAKRLTFRDPATMALTLDQLEGKFSDMRGKAMKGGKRGYWEAHKRFDAWRENDLATLVANNILVQGVSLRCPHCYTTHWYPVGGLRPTVACEGCLSSFPFPLKSQWSFRLNNLVVNAIRYHGTISVLHALYFMQSYRDARGGMFMYLPCQDLHVREEKKSGDSSDIVLKDGRLQVREGRLFTDLDFLAITNGRLSIGEVKSAPEGFASDDFAKLQTIAAELKPDELVVAAVGKAWPAAVNAQITSLSENLAKMDVTVSPLLLEWPRD